MSDIRGTGIIRGRNDQTKKRHWSRSRPHGMNAFAQAPSSHRRSTFIRYQFAAYAYTDCQSLDLLPWPDTVLATESCHRTPVRMVCFRSSTIFHFYFLGGQERRLYSSRSIAKKRNARHRYIV
ncbi:hypothetical protein LX36DRAFT_491332 [Colletotrichum falcatum]|nr:hypothetical protein LX36DRAFT_491332 [Colletotrichum falcatum]